LLPLPDSDGVEFKEIGLFTEDSLRILFSSKSYNFLKGATVALPKGGYYIGGRGDFDKDGSGDFWILRYHPTNQSEAFFIPGRKIRGFLDQGESNFPLGALSPLRLVGDRTFSEAGISGSMSATAGDIDGDGIPDFVVGDHYALNRSGAYFILPGALIRNTTGTISVADKRVIKVRGAPYGFIAVYYNHVDNIDFDSDGFDDLFITADSDTEAGTEAGAVYVLSGKKIIEEYARISP
jgi:hypothetical protein